jgi:hypothetical protein
MNIHLPSGNKLVFICSVNIYVASLFMAHRQLQWSERKSAFHVR